MPEYRVTGNVAGDGRHEVCELTGDHGPAIVISGLDRWQALAITAILDPFPAAALGTGDARDDGPWELATRDGHVVLDGLAPWQARAITALLDPPFAG